MSDQQANTEPLYTRKYFEDIEATVKAQIFDDILADEEIERRVFAVLDELVQSYHNAYNHVNLEKLPATTTLICEFMKCDMEIFSLVSEYIKSGAYDEAKDDEMNRYPVMMTLDGKKL